MSGTLPARRNALALLVWLSFLPTGHAEETETTAKSAPDLSAEPPLEFVLEAGDQKIPVRLEEPFELESAGKVSLKLTVKPYRTFQHAGIRFRYPQDYEFEADVESPEFVIWTLTGHDTTIILFKYPKGDADASLNSVTDSAIEQHGRKNVKQAKTSIQLAGKTLSGKRLDITHDDGVLRQHLFAFSTDEASFVLIIQDAADDGKAISEETAAAIKLLEDSFESGGGAPKPTPKPAKPKAKK